MRRYEKLSTSFDGSADPLSCSLEMWGSGSPEDGHRCGCGEST